MTEPLAQVRILTARQEGSIAYVHLTGHCAQQARRRTLLNELESLKERAEGTQSTRLSDPFPLSSLPGEEEARWPARTADRGAARGYRAALDDDLRRACQGVGASTQSDPVRQSVEGEPVSVSFLSLAVTVQLQP